MPCVAFVFRSARLAAGLPRALLVAALLVGLSPAWSQSSSAAAPGSASAPSSSQRALRSVSEDREMFEDLVHASLAEIEAGRLALDKTQNPQVRSFAQQMLDEHSRALQQLQQLGQKKQFNVPTEADFQHKAIVTALRMLSGEAFDRQYIRQAGVRDHRRAVDLLRKMEQTARDPDMKAHAGQALPGVQRHLAMARELDQTMR